MDVLPYAHAFVTTALVGLIWTVQIVSYPVFAAVGAESWRAYHAAHVRRTTAVVAPLMLAEVAAALLLLTLPTALPAWMPALGALLLLAVWTSTAAFQVPLHGVLARGYDARAQRRLVRTNWIRTAAWSARGVLALAMLAA